MTTHAPNKTSKSIGKLKIHYMQGGIVLLDPVEYSLSPIERLLALLNWMVRIETDYL
jgi:hypothetical protein